MQAASPFLSKEAFVQAVVNHTAAMKWTVAPPSKRNRRLISNIVFVLSCFSCVSERGDNVSNGIAIALDIDGDMGYSVGGTLRMETFTSKN